MSALLRRAQDSELLVAGLLRSVRLLATQPCTSTLPEFQQDQAQKAAKGQLGDLYRSFSQPSRLSPCDGFAGAVQLPPGVGFAARSISSSSIAADISLSSSQNPLHQLPVEGGQNADGSDMPEGQSPGRVAVCHLKGVTISPRKLTMAARLVRKMHIRDALVNMSIREKKAAKLVKKALSSAYHNAVNNHRMDGEKLIVAECFVGKGRHLKRIAIHGMGKTGRMEKPRAHLTVKLVESQSAVPNTHVVKPLLERKLKRPGAGTAASL
mmetsp:Transcript_17125/g.47785  ORF Transcript_17125/g.47785 Transcript_17125/m.47785 type:complete len:267 (+) Transcript_17125:154-954(+)|eukprot:CAMPEP_0117670576 /NCGR_PEP_ID=MMETSP0804-20121206/12842_1 /TAXON_ID=1074897 /ORGANISM="Tetraselmis astigmatica, Strain CCMP880" /LENGTH=266 /DNA_ID=CAMNT_0005478915 /DNA_START=84 /DNA_END=884 /DNA_ORIENTATION=+